MEIRRMLWGESASPVPAKSTRRAERSPTATRPSADRLELARNFVSTMEEQSARIQSALLTGGENREEEGGLLGYMETEEDKLDALSEQLDVQQKCLKIAMRIMQGKKVPPEDERYLMEHDPEGYKLALSMKSMVKEDKEECESVLDDEDKNGGEESSGETGEAAPSEGGEAE